MSERRSRFIPAEVDNFPVPHLDRMGLAFDEVEVSLTDTREGEQLTLLHKRPLVGGSMHLFLESVAPTINEHQIRPHVASNAVFTSENRARGVKRDEARQEFVDEQITLHSRRGYLGRSAIGEAFTAYQQEAMYPWAETLSVDRQDSVYAPLTRLYAYQDFDARVAAALDYWREVPRYKYGPHVYYERSARNIAEIVRNFGTTELPAEYDDLSVRADDGYDRYAYLMNHIVALPEEEVRDMVGMSISDHYHHGFHHFGGNHLVVDIPRGEFWYDRLRRYQPDKGDKENWDFYFEMPEVDIADNSMRLTDSEGQFTEISFRQPDEIFQRSPWEMAHHSVPEWASQEGLYAAISWTKASDGSRQFAGYDETKAGVERMGFELPGSADSYLGKLLIKYFAQPGEYEPSVREMKWLTEMGLAGSPRKQPMRVRELPVYIQLPQHQQDLLSSSFIKAVEQITD